MARRIVVENNAVRAVQLADGTELAADAVVCAVPNSNIAGLLDDLPEHAEIYAAAEKLHYTPIVSTNLYLDRPLGTEAAMESVIGGTGVIDEVFDRQRMQGRDPNGAWLLPDHQRRLRADPPVQRADRCRADGHAASLLSGSVRGDCGGRTGGQNAQSHVLAGGRHLWVAARPAHVGAEPGPRR
ncbi:hypothetical protein MMIN_00060 [Mycolicibacter minnesotensis]|nr:hypothetical protein MMIN_00060 [Mycolicibacter minnesotensis]